MKPFFLLLPTLALLAGLGGGTARAHGADEAPPASAAAPALPRFAAESEQFELVGELDGRTLTLYLDRADRNEPVPQAELTLDLGGASRPAQALGDGRYQLELPAALKPGLHAFTATLSVGEDSDLLAAELDLHGPDGHEHDAAPAAGLAARLRALLPQAAAGAALLALAGLGLRWQRARRRSGARS